MIRDLIRVLRLKMMNFGVNKSMFILNKVYYAVWIKNAFIFIDYYIF